MAEDKELIDQETEIVDTRDKKDDSSLIEEFKSRMRDSVLFEHDERTTGLEDLNFKRGELYQWPDDIKAERLDPLSRRPMITINKTPAFCDQIIGDGRQNKITIKVRATTNDDLNKDTAKVREGLIRNIQEQSNASVAYQTAEQGSVDAGRGVIGVAIIDNDQNPFNRDLRIEKVGNPYVDYFDPAYHTSGSERKRRYHIVSKLVSRGEFAISFKGKTPMQVQTGVGDTDTHVVWSSEENVRVADYWVKRPAVKIVALLDDGRIVDGEKWQQIQDELAETGEPIPTVLKSKEVKSFKILWYKMDGSQVLKGPKEWPGQYIPRVPVWGKEINVEGKRDVRGVIRNLKGPQRLYNYDRTAEAERNALAKTPPVELTPKMIAGGLEWMWKSVANLKYRLFNPDPKAPQGPKHNSPPQASTGNLMAIEMANREMHDVAGMQPPSLGKESSAGSSGKKEALLQKEGDVGNFEFHDNLARGIRQVGRILDDLLGYIYDSEREELILGEDNSEEFVKLNQKVLDEETGKEVVINDMAAGQYRVSVTVGASYTTQRQETLHNLSDLAKNIPLIGELMPDMIVKNMDFVGADEAIDRIRWSLITRGIIQPDEEEQKKLAEIEKNQEQGDPEDLDRLLKAAELQLKGREMDRKEFDTMVDSIKKMVEADATARGQALAEVTASMQRLEGSMKDQALPSQQPSTGKGEQGNV